VRRVILAFSSLALLQSACIKVVHDHDCDGGTFIGTSAGSTGGTNGGKPPTVYHAQALYVVNLARSAANLAGTYADLIGQLNADLGARNISVDEWAVLPLYGGVDGAPRLIYGDPSDSAGDLSAALSDATLSGLYDHALLGISAEQYNLAALAGSLDQATLPPPDVGGQSPTFFGPPLDLFLVVTLQSERRLCADSDAACTLSGLAPLDAFTRATDDGHAAWLKLNGGAYATPHVYQLFIFTGEQQSFTQLQTRCAAEAGFPKTLLDALQPSDVPYYGDLASGLGARGWHADQIDFCDAISSRGSQMIESAAAQISVAAAAAP
jgi:hypothetical protein